MLSLVLSSLLSALPALQPDQDPFPKANKPANFSQAGGRYDTITVQAAPTTVCVEEPITLVVKIKAAEPGPFRWPPRPGKVNLFPRGFDSKFFIEEVAEEYHYLDDENAWKLVYRIFPKSSSIKEIDRLAFAFFNTATQEYQEIVSAPVGIQVKPSATLVMGSPATIRKRMHPPASGAALLGDSGPGIALVVLGFALPPLLGIAGVVLWQRLFPDDAARARLRRSRAFRQAVKRLRRLGGTARATAVAAVVIQYLRARIDLTTAEPTPPEIKTALLAANLGEELAKSAEQFAQRCDAERFAPASHDSSARFAADATQLLEAVEAALRQDDKTARWQSGKAAGREAFYCILLCPLVSLSSCHLVTPSPTEDAATLAEADRRFEQGIAAEEQDGPASRTAFAQAAQGYQELVDKGVRHPELFRRLGDAYLLADDLPHAILAYRRGAKVGPHVQALWDHLELARDRVAYSAGEQHHRPPSSDWPSWLPRPSPTVLLGGAAALHALAWMAAAWWWMRRQPAMLVWALVLLVAALAALGWWGYGEWRKEQDNRRAFVVVAYNNVTLRRGNGTLYAPHGELPLVHRGMEARMLAERGGWVQVEFPGGEVGWLQGRQVLR